MDTLNTINIPISIFGKWVFPEEIEALTFPLDADGDKDNYHQLLSNIYYVTVIANQIEPFYHIKNNYEANCFFQYLNYQGKFNPQFNKWSKSTSISRYLIKKLVNSYHNKKISPLGGCIRDGLLADYLTIGTSLHHQIITPVFRERIARSVINNYLEWVGIGGKEERRFSEKDTETLVQLALVHPEFIKLVDMESEIDFKHQQLHIKRPLHLGQYMYQIYSEFTRIQAYAAFYQSS